MNDLAVIGDLAQKVGLVGLAFIAVWAFMTRRVYTRGEVMDRDEVWEKRMSEKDHQLKEIADDRNFWRDLALRGSEGLDKALSVAERMKVP